MYAPLLNRIVPCSKARSNSFEASYNIVDDEPSEGVNATITSIKYYLTTRYQIIYKIKKLI